MTNLEAIQILNKETRDALIKNADEVNRKTYGIDFNFWEKREKNEEWNLNDGITGFFSWHDSEEGHDYWENIHFMLKLLHSTN